MTETSQTNKAKSLNGRAMDRWVRGLMVEPRNLWPEGQLASECQVPGRRQECLVDKDADFEARITLVQIWAPPLTHCVAQASLEISLSLGFLIYNTGIIIVLVIYCCIINIPSNLVAENNTCLLSCSFCESGICVRLSWVLRSGHLTDCSWSVTGW